MKVSPASSQSTKITDPLAARLHATAPALMSALIQDHGFQPVTATGSSDDAVTNVGPATPNLPPDFGSLSTIDVLFGRTVNKDASPFGN